MLHNLGWRLTGLGTARGPRGQSRERPPDRATNAPPPSRNVRKSDKLLGESLENAASARRIASSCAALHQAAPWLHSRSLARTVPLAATKRCPPPGPSRTRPPCSPPAPGQAEVVPEPRAPTMRMPV